MAKTKSKATSVSVEEKLRALYRLQLIDSKIDKIRTVRGELPLEVEDLEDEIAGLDTRIEKINSEIKELEKSIVEKKNLMKDAEALIKRYEEQQNNVRNNREFESLAKEIEYQQLEIQLAEKRIKEFKLKIENKKQVLEEANNRLAERNKDLELKKAELNEIVAETQKEEDSLLAASKEAEEKIEERLLFAYKRIREKVINGLAVVPIERDSAGGSFIQIPPQRILDIAARKKIIVDEHSGRILVDQELATEEQEKIDNMIKLLKV